MQTKPFDLLKEILKQKNEKVKQMAYKSLVRPQLNMLQLYGVHTHNLT